MTERQDLPPSSARDMSAAPKQGAVSDSFSSQQCVPPAGSAAGLHIVRKGSSARCRPSNVARCWVAGKATQVSTRPRPERSPLHHRLHYGAGPTHAPDHSRLPHHGSPLLWPLSSGRKLKPQWRASSCGAKRPPAPAGRLVNVPKIGALCAPGPPLCARAPPHAADRRQS